MGEVIWPSGGLGQLSAGMEGFMQSVREAQRQKLLSDQMAMKNMLLQARLQPKPSPRMKYLGELDPRVKGTPQEYIEVPEQRWAQTVQAGISTQPPAEERKALVDISQFKAGIENMANVFTQNKLDMPETGDVVLSALRPIIGSVNPVMQRVNPGAASYEAAKQNPADILGRSRTGAAMPPEERKTYMQDFFPNYGDQYLTGINKLRGLLPAFKAKQEAILGLLKASNPMAAEKLRIEFQDENGFVDTLPELFYPQQFATARKIFNNKKNYSPETIEEAHKILGIPFRKISP